MLVTFYYLSKYKKKEEEFSFISLILFSFAIDPRVNHPCTQNPDNGSDRRSVVIFRHTLFALSCRIMMANEKEKKRNSGRLVEFSVEGK